MERGTEQDADLISFITRLPQQSALSSDVHSSSCTEALPFLRLIHGIVLVICFLK